MGKFGIRYLIIILLIATKLFAQDSITISGTVKDFYTNQQLPFANISIKNTYIGTSTDIFGKFRIKIPKSFLPIELSSNFMGYEDTSIAITQSRNQNCTFLLYPKAIDINEITVNSEKNVVFGDRDYQILDYILYKNKILLITYKKKLSKSILVMTDMFGKTIAAIPIRGKPIKIHVDCINEVFLICQSLPYVIHVKDESIRLQRAYQDKFNKLVKPCIASSDDMLIYKYTGPLALSIEYFAYNQTENEFNLFAKIDDEFQQNLFVEDFNYLLESNGIKVLGNTNTYESLRRFRMVDMKEVLRYDMMHHPIYAPLFIQKDTVVIFDHPNSKIQKHAVSGEYVSSVPIKYEQMKGWLPQIIFDDVRNKYYSTVIKGGKSTFYKIDINTGKTIEVKRVSYSWIEKPVIKDNTLYFLYRRKDKNSAKYLYYEDL